MNKIFLTVLFLFSIFKVFAQPPACTNTLVAGGGVQIVNAGQVFCVPPEGHEVVCIGTFSIPNAICSGSQTVIDGSVVLGETFIWQKENTLNVNNWVSIIGNKEDLVSETNGNLSL